MGESSEPEYDERELPYHRITLENICFIVYMKVDMKTVTGTRL